MTSGNLSKPYRPGLRLYLLGLKRQMLITLLAAGFLLIVNPPVSTGYYEVGGEVIYDPSFGGVIVIYLISVLLGIVLLCYNHSYLFSRNSSDLFMSLPLKRDKLLLVRFGTALTGVVFTMTTGFFWLISRNLLTDVPIFQMLKLYLLCLMLVIFTLTVIYVFLLNSGGIFHFIFSLIMFSLIALIALFATLAYEEAAQGFFPEYEWVKYTNPLIYGIVELVLGADQLGGEQMAMSISWVTFLVCILGTAAFLALALYLNRKRPAERSGSGYAFPFAPYVIAVVAACCGGYIMGKISSAASSDVNDVVFWITAPIGVVLIGIGVGAIATKGFRKIWRWLACSGIALLLLILVVVVPTQLGKRDGHRLPSIMQINSATISPEYGEGVTATFTDREIPLVHDLHKHLIAIEYGEKERVAKTVTVTMSDGTTKQEEKKYFYPTLFERSISITYTLSDGSTMTRDYTVTDWEGLRLLLKVVRTDTYAENWAVIDPDVAYYDLSCKWNNQGTPEATVLTPAEYEQLMLTYGREMQQLTPADLLDADDTSHRIYFPTADIPDVYIPESFTETIQLLEEYLD